MKINQIAKILKKNKTVILYDDAGNNVQWISDGGAAWPLYGMPELTGITVLTVLDVPEKDRAKYAVHMESLPGALSFKDSDAGEYEMPPASLNSINFGSQLLAPARTAKGLMFYNPEYLKPLKDENVTMYARTDRKGKVYFAAKSGLLLKGIILPMKTADSEILERLDTLADELRETIERGIKVDESTGEVVE